MAFIEKRTQNSQHLRSNSLPSAAHPFVSQFEEHLRISRASEATSSLSSSSVSHKLNVMLDLQNYTDKLLQLTTKQQVLAQECNEKWGDDLLEGSLRLLDICAAAKDCLQQSKESMCDLVSIMRRKKGNETRFAVESVKYLAVRKKIKKQIRKALLNLKHKDNNTSPMLSFLDEAEAITISTLESLLLFISAPKEHSRWSAISKLVRPKRVICDSQESTINEFEKVDAALKSLISHKASSTENFQSHMENLELCIQDLEIGVDHLSRKLIRNRVSLLNIFNR